MQRLTITHVRRWQEHRDAVGEGHLYQGRYKSFPIETDDHFYRVARYVERNALRARLVERAEDWKWSSLWLRRQGTVEARKLLSAWPMSRPSDWADLVNEPQTEAELDALRHCVSRGRPFGGDAWTSRTAQRLGLQSSLRAPHRPRNA